MNPILLKPVSDQGSEVIVQGVSQGPLKGKDYFAFRRNLIPVVMQSFQALAERADIIVIEGAGSPAEINLRQHDIVNMGLAKLVDAPVLLVGDINPGGVFSQIIGTLVLLEEEERARVKGTIINKFRGDVDLLLPGVVMLEERSGLPNLGVLPWLDVYLPEEDSLSEHGVANHENHPNIDDRAFRETQYDLVAAALRKHLDIEHIYRIIENSASGCSLF